MSVLAKAPLVEAIFELRWGFLSPSPVDVRQAQFVAPSQPDFEKNFASCARSSGLAISDSINLELPPLPHIVKTRFRATPGSWPCYQIGTGIFTANQANDGYEWKSFREAIVRGLEFVSASYSGGLNAMPLMGVELRYQDAFLLQAGETAEEFLTKKLEVKVAVPKQFVEFSRFDNGLRGHGLSFQLRLKDPAGVCIVALNEALINGAPGFVMEVSVRSADKDKPTPATVQGIAAWLDGAHQVQKHAFDTLINPIYKATFK